MPLILNGSTGISGTDGSAGTPAVQGTDTNTGMYFPAADQIAFAEGGVEAMRLDASGNVGIGTTTPGQRLQISNSSSSGFAAIRMATDARAYDVGVGGSASGFQQNNWYIYDVTAAATRVVVNSGGNLFVGTASSFGNAGRVEIDAGASGNGLNVRCASSAFSIVCFNNGGSGLVYFTTTGSGSVGTITTNGSTTSYNSSSDYRLKANVVPLTGAAARVQALKPSRFNFIADPDRTVDGFIAHEAAEVVPEAVHGEKDAVNEDGSIKPQGIDHSKLVPLLTAALQEALTEIASLKARVAALEATP